MTVSSTTNRVSYAGNGTASPLAVSFPFLAPADLKVVATIVLTGAQSVLSLNHDYTVTGTPDANGYYTSGGSVVPSSSIPSGTNWTIYRDPAITQLVAHVDNDPLPAESIDTPVDRLTMIAQRLSERMDRAISAPDGEPLLNWTLPSVPDRANKLLAFGSDGSINLDLPDVAGMDAAAAAAEATLQEVEAAIAALGSSAVDLYRPTDAYLNTPTGSEPSGYRALVGKAPSGAFAGKRGLVALKNGGSWLFSATPKDGQRIFDIASGMFWISRNGWWNKLKPGFTGYQDFADVPDGTAIQSFVIATGQTVNGQGAGAGSGLITNGRYEPPSNTYIVFAQPSKHVKFGLRGRWKSTHANGNAFALAAGVYSGGAIISKMGAHTSFGYQQAPAVSIWGGPRQTDIGGGPLGYLIEPDLQYEYQAIDTNLPVHGANVDVVQEVQVSGNTIRVWADGGHWANSYNDDMVSALLGDDGSGNGGYIYFQTGENLDANNPYIYEIWWTALDTPQEMLPDPKQVPDASKVPIISEGDFVFNGGTELFRYTPLNGGKINMFEIDVSVVSSGVVAGYGGVLQKWRCGGGNFGGTVYEQTPVQLGSDYVMAPNPGVMTLSGALGQAVSGSDILIIYTPTRTGTDATVYNPRVKAILRQMATLTTVSP